MCSGENSPIFNRVLNFYKFAHNKYCNGTMYVLKMKKLHEIHENPLKINTSPTWR